MNILNLSIKKYSITSRYGCWRQNLKGRPDSHKIPSPYYNVCIFTSFICLVFEIVSLCLPGYPGTHFEEQTSPELRSTFLCLLGAEIKRQVLPCRTFGMVEDSIGWPSNCRVNKDFILGYIATWRWMKFFLTPLSLLPRDYRHVLPCLPSCLLLKYTLFCVCCWWVGP